MNGGKLKNITGNCLRKYDYMLVSLALAVQSE